VSPMRCEVVKAGRLLLSALVPAVLVACDVPSAAPPVAGAPTLTAAPVASPTPAGAVSPPTPPTVLLEVMSGASAAPAGPGAYRFHVEVPQVAGRAASLLAVDAAIRGTLVRQVNDFLDAARDGPAGPTPSDLTCTNRSLRITTRLAVLRVDCTEYQTGAAHPSTVTHAFNCDLSSGRVLRLQDVFSPGAAYLGLLSTAAQDQLRGRLGQVDEQTLLEGTGPVVENFKVFLLDRGALVIVFARYQVRPGPAGEPEVSIPLATLQHYLARGIPELTAG
jgi:hypothetical protein